MIKLKDLWEETQNVVCAWCKTPYGYNPSIPAGTISHGMCDQCAKKMTQTMGTS